MNALTNEERDELSFVMECRGWPAFLMLIQRAIDQAHREMELSEDWEDTLRLQGKIAGLRAAMSLPALEAR